MANRVNAVSVPLIQYKKIPSAWPLIYFAWTKPPSNDNVSTGWVVDISMTMSAQIIFRFVPIVGVYKRFFLNWPTKRVILWKMPGGTGVGAPAGGVNTGKAFGIAVVAPSFSKSFDTVVDLEKFLPLPIKQHYTCKRWCRSAPKAVVAQLFPKRLSMPKQHKQPEN